MFTLPTFKQMVDHLQDEYGLHNVQVTFLPLGADKNTAIYRVETRDKHAYFLKLRSGPFDETSVKLPKFYSDQGIQCIISPLPTKGSQLWGVLDEFKTILYPFIEGRDAYEVEWSDNNWVKFGSALKKLHASTVPETLTKTIRFEDYSPKWRETVRTFMSHIETDSYNAPTALELVSFLKTKRKEVLDLVDRAEELAKTLQFQPRELTVCHSDLHAGNLLITKDSSFYIVDWDEPILAPKERDLMYIGGGLLGSWRSPQEEEAIFYSSYGKVAIDPAALAYYRYERIVRDIGEYCELLLLTNDGGENREQFLRYLKSNFLTGGAIEIAYQSDNAEKAG